MMDARQFWFLHFAKRLDPSLDAFAVNFNVATFTNAGLAQMRIGAKDVYYACSPSRAIAIGALAIPQSASLEVHLEDAKRRIARHLIHDVSIDAFEPMMLGVISRANPTPSFQISHSPWHMFFCEANAGFMFDLQRLQEGYAALKDQPWKKVSEALFTIEEARIGVAAKQKKLAGIMEKTPDLIEAIMASGITGRSPEHQLLAWANFGLASDRRIAEKTVAIAEADE